MEDLGTIVHPISSGENTEDKLERITKELQALLQEIRDGNRQWNEKQLKTA